MRTDKCECSKISIQEELIDTQIKLIFKGVSSQPFPNLSPTEAGLMSQFPLLHVGSPPTSILGVIVTQKPRPF